MLKYGQFFFLLPCFQRLFNYILNSGKYPKLWSHGLIFPFYKSDNAHDPFYYRGIAITSCLAKLYVMSKLAFAMDLEKVIISLN